MPHQPIYLPGATRVGPSAKWGRTLTILEQDVEALLHEKSCVEDDEPEAEWENVVTGADFEEILDLFLCRSKVTWGISRTVPAQRCAVPAAAAGSFSIPCKEWGNDRGLGKEIDEVWYGKIICATSEIRSESR